MVDTSLIYLGRYRVVRWMRFEDEYPAKSYLFDETSRNVQARVLAICRMIGDRQELPDGTIAHHLKSPYQEIYELKPDGHRVFGFFYRNCLYLVSGAAKAKPKEQVADYKRAERLRLDFLTREEKKKHAPEGR